MEQAPSMAPQERHLTNRQVAQSGVLIALVAVAAQVTVAIGPVPFTLQLLIVALAALVFSPAQAALSLFVYVLLGLVGFPVFSGMTGGVGKLLGVTGGYIYGFIASAALGAFVRRAVCNPTRQAGAVRKLVADILACAVTVVVCYAIGTCHFMAVTAVAGSGVEAAYVLGVCVVPFIVPDLLKCAAAIAVARALRAAIPSVSQS